jgi:hypothetical protein
MLLLVISLILALLPLLGVVWIVLSGWLATVDGLFLSLILLAISGLFALSALLELRARGWLPFFHSDVKPPDAKTATASAQPRSVLSGPVIGAPPPSSEGIVTESGTVEDVRLYEMPVGYADKSLVSFRPAGSAQPRQIVFSGNVQHLRTRRPIRLSYRPSPDGNVLLAWE